MSNDNRVGLVVSAGIAAAAAVVAKGFRDLQEALSGERGEETREFTEGFLLWCRRGCPIDDPFCSECWQVCFEIAEDALDRAAEAAHTVDTLLGEEGLQ
jgi:hypothetical protein